MPAFNGTPIDQGATPKFKGQLIGDAPADPGTWERGVLAPVEKNSKTGEMRLAWPQILVDMANAMTLPGDVYTGKTEVDLQDPSNELIGRSLGLAALPATGATGAPAAIAKAAGEAALDPGAKALVLRGLKEGGMTPSQVPSALQSIGPDAVIGDLTPTLQGQAQAIATMPGPGQKIVVDALSERAAGRNARVTGGVDETLGKAPIPSAIVAANKENMNALSPEYMAAFKGAKWVDTQPVADNLDAAIVNLRGDAQKALEKVRDMLDIKGVKGTLDPNPMTLFQTRQAIDGLLETEQNSKVIGALSDVRKQIDGILADRVPGIKAVDAKFQELATQNKALETGSQVLRTGPEAVRPSELVEQVVNGAQPKGISIGPSAEPFRLSQGARADIDRLIGTKANDLLALKQAIGGEGDWNRAKLATLFGEEKADKLLGIITRELKYQQLERDALGGSRTQKLKAAQEEIIGRPAAENALQYLMDFKPGSASKAALQTGIGWASKAGKARMNAALADLLMSKDGQQIAQRLREGRSLIPLAGASMNTYARGNVLSSGS